MKQDRLQLGLIARLATRDYQHEWVMSGCFVLALSAVLIPLLVLFGLKFGIISNLLDPLKENARYREILPSGAGRFDAEWFENMGQRSDVEFLVPRTRTIAATMKVRRPESDVGRILDVELIPSAPGDPVLGPEGPTPAGFEQVVLSADAADKLGVEAGEQLQGILSRTLRGEQESVLMPLSVSNVAPAVAFSRDGMFVSTDLMVAVEEFRDGRAVPALGWTGVPPREEPRRFAGFRLYARTIDDVAALREDLLGQGIDVRTHVADIELVTTLDRNLSLVYWIIAIIAVSGYCLSFGASVWANVDRKRSEFSLLRLAGFRSGGIVLFPLLQAALTGAIAWILACIGYLIVQTLLNALFASSLGYGQPVCRLLPSHLVMALLLTLVAAVLSAVIGGARIAQVEPSLGLRNV